MIEPHIHQLAIMAGAKFEGDRYTMTEAQLIDLVRMVDPGSALVVALADVLDQRGLKPVLKVG